MPIRRPRPLVRSSLILAALAACAGGADSVTGAPTSPGGAVAAPPATPPAVASVEVSPASGSVTVGQSGMLTATVKDPSGNVLGGRVVSWAVSDAALASVATSGDGTATITGRQPGTVTVTATVEGRTGTASVVVLPAPVAAVAVTSAGGTTSITAGQSLQLAAALSDAAGNSLAGRTVAWATSSGAIATVDAAGLVHAASPGSVTISATSEGKSGSIALVVAAAPVTAVMLSTPAATLRAGQTLQLTATSVAGGAASTRATTWTSSNTAAATVSPTGLVTAVAPGTAVITATAGGVCGTATVTVTLVPVATIAIAAPSTSLYVGQTMLLAATTRDSAGGPLAGRPVTWSSSSAGVASVSAAGLLTAIAPGSATITATSEGRTATVAIVVARVPVASVQLGSVAPTMTIGSTQQLSAMSRDSSGAALAGRAVTWSSSAPSVATVSASGLVTAVAPGTATITAASEGHTASTTIAVAGVVRSVSVTPPAATLDPGGAVTLVASVAADSGVARSVRWTTSSAAVATVGADGVVRAVAPGQATITAIATADSSKRAAVAITVAAGAPSITVVSPATLAPGGTAIIDGSNFSSTPASDAVTIGGIAATVTSATATRITVQIAASGYPCRATQSVPVVVTVGGRSVTLQQPLQTAAARALAVGQEVQLLDAGSIRCNELPAGGRYLISVFNTSTTPSAITPFTMTGVDPTATYAASASPAGALLPSFNAAATSFTAMMDDPAAPGEGSLHERLLDEDRQLVRRLGTSIARRAPRLSLDRSPAGGPALSTAPTAVGALMQLRMRSQSSCGSYTTVTARVAYAGSRAIVLEDTAAPLARQVDTVYQRIGRQFDTSLYGIESTFGDPAAFDTYLDNPGRVLMLFTPQVNGWSPNLLGFVSACDLYPATTDPSVAASNQTKIFYARVPTTFGSATNRLDEVGLWKASMPATLVHETKHIVSNVERFSRHATTLEESWLEEATAQVASELYGRTVYGTSWRGNATYAQTMRCDVRPGWSDCPGSERIISNHFAFLRDYFASDEGKSILSPGSVDPDIYGSAWLFVRWLLDQYGGSSEATLLRALTQETTLSGVANVTARTGKSWPALLADFSLSLIADDYPGFTPPAGARYTIPSWNTRDMWSGYAADFGGAAFPLAQHTASFGAFTAPVAGVAGGSASLFELSGSLGQRQVLDLSSLPAATPFRVAIVRVQ